MPLFCSNWHLQQLVAKSLYRKIVKFWCWEQPCVWITCSHSLKPRDHVFRKAKTQLVTGISCSHQNIISTKWYKVDFVKVVGFK